MATEKWSAGAVASYAAAFGTELNSLASGSSVLSGTALTNAANLDVFCDLSISLGSVTPGGGAPYLGFYLLPLNEDGTTYGDGSVGASAAIIPPNPYWVGNILCRPSTTGVITGTVRGIILPPSAFKFALYNLSGTTLPASGNAVLFKTYNRSIA